MPAYNLNWGPEGCESDGIKTRRLYESKQTYDVPKHVYKFMKNVKSKWNNFYYTVKLGDKELFGHSKIDP